MALSPVSFQSELSAELENILHYWLQNMPDYVNGGFIGQIDFSDEKHADADKGSVLNARILWAFAAGYGFSGKTEYLLAADRAFAYIKDYFHDPLHGGIFWSVKANGTPSDTKNQVYAIAFVIYGLSEYYAVSHNEEALEMAISLVEKIEQYSFDPVHQGYLEAFTRDWQPIEDLRLSDKDANEKKTMNTHLHIVEAYANLYKVWNNEALQKNIVALLETIERYFIDTENGHLKLFFDETWVEKPDVISFGHDIEAAWLLLQCAEISGDAGLIERYRKYAVLMANATIRGLDTDGGLWYEYDPKTHRLIREKHWWPQSEALIGFINAWQLTGELGYYEIAARNWKFIKENIIDTEKGEWIWGVDGHYSKIEKDKAGFWKCPYHNTRACIEVIKRLK